MASTNSKEWLMVDLGQTFTVCQLKLNGLNNDRIGYLKVFRNFYSLIYIKYILLIKRILSHIEIFYQNWNLANDDLKLAFDNSYNIDSSFILKTSYHDLWGLM